jgi:C-terminal peptidase prc
MSKWIAMIVVLGAIGPAAVLGQQDGKPQASAAIDPQALARTGWSIADLVLASEVDPDSRESMLLGGVRALLAVAGVARPQDLERRVREVKDTDQYAALVQSLWPAGLGPNNATPEALRDAFIDGIRPRLPRSASDPEPPDAKKVREQLAANRYVGVGIQLDMDPQEMRARISNPFYRGPARKAGARRNDLILEVDGQSTEGANLSKVVGWLRGDEGTPVTVVVRQPGSDQKRTLAMVRGVVPIDTVYGYRRKGDSDWTYRIDPSTTIGYLWIRAINSSTVHELRQAEHAMRSEGIGAVVLDFRDSSGDGPINQAADVADWLLDGGPIYRTRDVRQNSTEVKADRECLFRGWPIVALTNGIHSLGQGTVLAALQDNGRATLVGEPTRVEGYAYAVLALPDDLGTLRVRAARFERSAQGRGWPVLPDETVGLGQSDADAIARWLQAKGMADPPAESVDPPASDPQLTRALERLKSARAQAH